MPNVKQIKPRFVGIKNNYIHVVSDREFAQTDLQTIDLSEEFANVSSEDLITNFRYSNGQLKAKRTSKPFSEQKIAFVSNWAQACGISTYFENLLPELSKDVKDFKLFIENQDFIKDIYIFGNSRLNEEQIIPCWKRGDQLNDLIAELKNYDPDIIIFNHEHGIWSNAARWMSMMTQLSQYRVVVIEHSVFPNHKDKTIVEACMPEIIVHLEGAKEALIKKGISSKIHVIPHGCYAPMEGKLWNFYKTNHTIIQTGFGFKYKGFEDTIEACALLKNEYNDVFLTLLFSESAYNKAFHQIYYNELMQLVEKLSLQDNVCIVRGFQTDEVVQSYLRTNNVVVLPYKSNEEHLVFGSSGIARLSMAANIPVISSNIPHFSDLPTIKCNTPEEIAAELNKLFSNSSFYKEQVDKQNCFIADNSWSNVALKFISILETFSMPNTCSAI